LPATTTILSASFSPDQSSCVAAAFSTRPTYSVPPLVLSAKSCAETPSRSSVKGESTCTQPDSAGWPSLP
jgi:hypothetical protein